MRGLRRWGARALTGTLVFVVFMYLIFVFLFALRITMRALLPRRAYGHGWHVLSSDGARFLVKNFGVQDNLEMS